jgi:hypothetical protein
MVDICTIHSNISYVFNVFHFESIMHQFVKLLPNVQIECQRKRAHGASVVQKSAIKVEVRIMARHPVVSLPSAHWHW